MDMKGTTENKYMFMKDCTFEDFVNLTRKETRPTDEKPTKEELNSYRKGYEELVEKYKMLLGNGVYDGDFEEFCDGEILSED